MSLSNSYMTNRMTFVVKNESNIQKRRRFNRKKHWCTENQALVQKRH